MQVTENPVGITATVPAEVLFAAGLRPLDMNNVFITSEDPERYIRVAENRGFPVNLCSWIKGIYGVVKEHGIQLVVGLIEGDCSNTLALLEVLGSEGVETVQFAYPHGRDPVAISKSLEAFRERFGVTLGAATEMKTRLDEVRQTLHEIDRLCWREGVVTGEESFLWHISSSDFGGDFEDYGRRAARFAEEARARDPVTPRFRLALAGIPPVVTDLHRVLEGFDSRVVFDEIPRQFSMPGESRTLVEQYARFTYPYDVFGRIADIRAQTAARDVDGVVNYVQSFCYRGIEAKLIEESLDIPALTLEFDRPGTVDSRSLTRIEAFIELLEARKNNA